MVATRGSRLKRIFFDRLFQRSYWTWRKHPAIIVPTMLGTGLSAIGQSIITFAAIVVLSSFAVQNILFDFLVTIRNQGLIQALQSPGYAPTIIPTAVIGVAILAVASILGGGFVYSAEYATYLEAWTKDNATFRSIIDNGSRTWKKMAWTLLLNTIITWGPLAAGLILLLQTLPTTAVTPQGLATFVASSYAFIFLAGTSLFLALFTLYTYAAVVVDNVSGIKAIRQSFHVASHNLPLTFTYAVVRVIFQLLSILITVFAGFVGLPLTAFATAILSLLLTPVLHSTKTMIYYHAGPAVTEMPFTLTDPIGNDLFRRLPRAAWVKTRTGLAEIAQFLASSRNLPFHAASVLALTVGILLGQFVSNNGFIRFYLDELLYQPGQLNPLLTQVIPPALGVDLFLHNWLVSIAAALAGIGFAFPSFQVILFNGFVLGLITPLIPDLTMLLAILAPHGVIEIPAFVLAGSVGLKLGYASILTRARPGPGSREYLSLTLRQAVYIVIGLAPLFLIAGLIEADLTPFIARMFGWS